MPWRVTPKSAVDRRRLPPLERRRLSENRSIAKLVCGGEAMFRHASRPVRAVSVDSRHLNCRGVVHVVETGWTGRHFPGLEEA